MGDVICIVEAMKMENEVAAHQAGTVKDLKVAAGDGVQAGTGTRRRFVDPKGRSAPHHVAGGARHAAHRSP